MRGNGSANLLARVIAERIRQQTAAPDANELGTIQPDLSLKLDRFQVPILEGAYLVCRGIDPPLADGDRVLVAWVNGGSDPVVVGVIG